MFQSNSEPPIDFIASLTVLALVPGLLLRSTEPSLKVIFQLKHVLRKTQGFFEEAQNFAAAAPGAQVDAETGEEERIRLLNRANGII